MKSKQIRILIVEDDSTQGKALLEALNRAGYQATWSNSSAQAITLAQRTEFHCLLVDCMLPKMNGIDLVEEINKLVFKKPKVFLFSGIYKDRLFVKEALERTQALGFLQKPLNLEEILTSLQQEFKGNESEQTPPLLSIYSHEKMGEETLLKTLEYESAFSSFHLPAIFRRFQQTELSGELTLVSAKNEMSTVSFYKGQIFSVQTADKESYFGGLAVSFGFVSPDDVLEALNNPEQKRLGQKLIESFSISPHAINVIMEEQLALRLSQTIQKGVVTAQWAEQKFGRPDFALNPLRLETLMQEWSASKAEISWIKSNLLLWGSYSLAGDYHPTLKTCQTIDALLAADGYNEDQDLPYLFGQLMLGNAYLGPKGADSQNFSFLDHRLDKILEEQARQNYFEILAVGEKAKTAELNKAFQDLKSFFDPQSLPPTAPPSVVIKCTKVFQNIEEAFAALSDDTKRAAYVTRITRKNDQEILEHEPIYKSAVMEIQSGQARSAAQKFQLLLDKNLNFRDLKAYRIWAGLSLDRNYTDLTLDMIPPEQRHSAAYVMAKAMLYRSRGQIQKALESIRAAQVLDPRLSGKSELEHMVTELERKGGQRGLLDGWFGKSGRRGA